MASLEIPPSSEAPKSPVPLDTIPISPTNETDSAGSADEKPTTSQATATSREPKSADEQITVFHDPENFNVKHPLMHEWTLWFTKPPSGKVIHFISASHLPALVLTGF